MATYPGGGVLSDDKKSFLIDRIHTNELDSPLNKDWAFSAFILPENEFVDPVDAANRGFSSASTKFTDGRFGCNIGINCYPQITPYADFPDPGRMSTRSEPSIFDSTGNYGLGTFWSEIFDDPAQIIYVQPGVAEFNSLFSFFTGAFNHKTSVLARTGRWPSLFYDIAYFFGTFTMLTTFPMLVAPLITYRLADYFFFRQSAKYYHHRQTPHLYWGAVNNIVNTMAINEGIYPRIMNANKDDSARLGRPWKLDQEQMDIYHQIAPDIFTEENYIDAFAYSTRAQRMANQAMEDEFNQIDDKTATDYVGWLKKELTGDGRRTSKFTDKTGEVTFSALLDNYIKWPVYNKSGSKDETTAQDPRLIMEKEGSTEGGEAPNEAVMYSGSTFRKFGDALNAVYRQGANFAIFRVEHTGATSESFSSSTQQAEFASKLNGISSNFANKRFTLGNGAILGDTVEALTGAVKDVAMGLAGGLTGGLPDAISGILGEGFLEVPEHWANSVASLPTMRYKMILDIPYSNPLSRILGLYIPFAMVAALFWPKALGRQSYGSPFLVKVFDQGRVQSPLAMPVSLTIARGGGNLGFTTNKKPTRFELTFEFKDLSTVLSMPVFTGVWDNSSRTMIDEESTITNYLAAVTGMSLYDQIYPMAKAKVRLAKLAMSIGTLTSSSYWASAIHDTTTQGILKYTGVPILLEAMARNSETVIGTT